MKVITFEMIKNLNISPYTCFEWVSESILHKKDALLPAKISLKPNIEGVFYNTMPSILPLENLAGLKLVTRYPERKPSLDSQILLYNLSSGENIAIMDGNWITAMRTGAVAAHTIKNFAIDDFSILGFIGLGNTARSTLSVLLSIYPDRKFTIKLLKYKDQHLLFAERFKEFETLNFVYCETYEEVIKDSDVIVSAATVFEHDICNDNCFKEGVLVVPIHTRGFTNCDLFFDKVFADDIDHVKGFKNFGKFKYFSEVSDVVNGINEGRKNNKERIIAYNIGIALHDIHFAGKIYSMIDDCDSISLDPPKEKFWL